MEQKVIKEDTTVRVSLESKPSTADIKVAKFETVCDKIIEKDQNALQYFECASCGLREKFEYFGKEPPFLNNYKLLEEAYVVEDPFLQPKHGKILILGSHCIKCNKMVCKNTNCSIYFKGTFCIDCAKKSTIDFPKAIQEKLNRILI